MNNDHPKIETGRSTPTDAALVSGVATDLHQLCGMPGSNVLNRRLFLTGSASLAVVRREPERVYAFATAEYEIRMGVEFYDGYTSKGFGFKERLSERQFCLSAGGREDQDCLRNFRGSIAVAHYRIRSRRVLDSSLSIREYVRSIDQSERLPLRPPFERTIELQDGAASDIQVFGREDEAQSKAPDDSWCFLRQDLFLRNKRTPFLVVHWKHTLSAIRVLDVIPGEGTWQV